MKVTVLGSGAWGTALALVLLENGHTVRLWSYLQSECDTLQATHENPMLPGVTLPDPLELTADLASVADAEVIVLATPSFAYRATASRLKGLIRPDAAVVSVGKGFEKGTGLRLSEVITSELGAEHPVVVLCGPTHAEEVGRGVPTAIVAASSSRAAAELVQDLFMNPRFRVYTSSDVIGCEVGAALKNVMAVCAGVIDGLGYGDNTRAMMMTRGLTEMARLGIAMGGHQRTFAGLTGVGDLIVTCTSTHSRNHTAGVLIGQGMTPEEALEAMGGKVVEGYYAAVTGKELAEKWNVELPITQAAYSVLYEGKKVSEVFFELMTRRKNHEVEDAWV